MVLQISLLVSQGLFFKICSWRCRLTFLLCLVSAQDKDDSGFYFKAATAGKSRVLNSCLIHSVRRGGLYRKTKSHPENLTCAQRLHWLKYPQMKFGMTFLMVHIQTWSRFKYECGSFRSFVGAHIVCRFCIFIRESCGCWTRTGLGLQILGLLVFTRSWQHWI